MDGANAGSMPIRSELIRVSVNNMANFVDSVPVQLPVQVWVRKNYERFEIMEYHHHHSASGLDGIIVG